MKEIEKILIATHNPAKKARYSRLLSTFTEITLYLDDLDIKDKPKESGETAEKNAEIKAKFYVQKTGLPVFSEDETLFVNFLPPEKQPGVHVRRINGKDEVDDDRLLTYWDEIISRIPKDKRTGKWHVAYCLALPSGKIKTVALDHPVLFFSPPSEIRLPGWPMSSLEGPIKFGKPHSELTEVERHQYNQEANILILKLLKELFG